MEREKARQEIRARISCKGYLQKSAGTNQYCCPYCGSGKGKNRTGALHFYEDSNTWHCFSCGRSGDVIDLHSKQTGADFNTALRDLADSIGITIDPYKITDDSKKNDGNKPARTNEKALGYMESLPEDKMQQNGQNAPTEATPDYSAYYEACRDRIEDPAARKYLEDRKISAETAKRFSIGFDPAADPASAPGGVGPQRHPAPRIIIPVSKNYYIARRIDGNPDYKYMYPKGNRKEVFNQAALYAQEAQAVYVVEGAIDALSIMQAGAPAIALNGAGAGTLLDQLKQRKTKAGFLVCQDNDSNPKTRENVTRQWDALRSGLAALKIDYLDADIAGEYKDANEALQKDQDAFTDAVRENYSFFVEERQRAAAKAEDERRHRTGAGMIDSFLAEIRTERFKPIPTGISDIDRAIGGGFLKQQIILLGAAPGAGKTALAQWIFEGMAKRGQQCIYLNLEMSREQMLARSLARVAAQYLGEHINPTEVLKGYEWDIAQEATVMEAARIYKEQIGPNLIYNPKATENGTLDSILEYLEAEARRAEESGQPVPCVVLDYLQILRGQEREDEVQIIKRAMKSLKDFAVDHNTFVFVIIAHNRTSNKSGDATQESGRDTSALEYGADLQLAIAFTACMKKYGNKDKDDLTPDELKRITLKVTKSRWGQPGAEAHLFFDGESMNYSLLTKEEVDATIGLDWNATIGDGRTPKKPKRI